MKVLHILACGNNGGIESLVSEYASNSVYNNSFMFIWEMGDYADALIKQGFEVFFIDKNKNSTINSILRILGIIKKEKYDIVVTHHGSPLIRALVLIIRLLFPKLIVLMYCHCDAFDELKGKDFVRSKLRYAINYLAAKSATRIIAISEYVKGSVVRGFKADPDRVTVVYNGVDIHKFDTQIKAIPEQVRFIYAGRLVEVKGVQIALRALASIKDEIDFVFYIVGDGLYRPKLEELSKTLEISDRCSFLGRRNDIPDLLKKADVFLHTCMWEEGFGIGIVEAMATGKICICSNSGAIPEIITDGVDGFLFPIGDVEKLKNCIQKIVGEKNRMDEIQHNAQERAKKYDIFTYITQLDSLMECLKNE